MAFNNAGIEGEVRPLVEQTEANYDAVMDINVKGVWLSMRYEIPRMLERGGGAIVNCCVGRRVDRVPEHRDLHCLETRRHRSDEDRRPGVFREGIRVNAVNPAVIDTEMVDRLAVGLNMKKDDLSTLHPIGRIGRVEEVAEAVLGFAPAERPSLPGTV